MEAFVSFAQGIFQRFILRQFTGNSEVYQTLLDYSCPNLPTVYEVAVQGEENLVISTAARGQKGNFSEGNTFFLMKLQDFLDD
mgnify:CR=1 FL=1